MPPVWMQSKGAGDEEPAAAYADADADEGFSPSFSAPAASREFKATDPQPCPHHEDEMLTLFCKTCEVPVCSWCLLDGDHVDHPRQNLTMAHDERRTELVERLAVLSEHVGQMDGHVERLKARPAEVELWSCAIREDITSRMAALRAKLEEAEAQLLAEQGRMLKAEMDTTEEADSDAQRTAMTMQRLVQDSTVLVETRDAYVFLDGFAAMKTNLEELFSSPTLKLMLRGVGLPAVAVQGCGEEGLAGLLASMRLDGGEAGDVVPLVLEGGTPRAAPASDAGASDATTTPAAVGSPMSPPPGTPAPQQAGTTALPQLTPQGNPKAQLVITVGENMAFPTIGLALEAAGPGDHIAVFPGTYRESVSVTKPVEIVGVGVAHDIIVECSSTSPVLWAWAQYCSVTNITLLQSFGGEDGEHDAVQLEGGSLVMDGCFVQSHSGSCVVVSNSSICELKRCKLHGARRDGVRVEQRANCFVDNNVIIGNLRSGVTVTHHGVATLRQNRILESARGHGVLVERMSKVTMEKNEISKNALSNVEVWEGAEVLMTLNRIHSSQRSGVFVHSHAAATLENNHIYRNMRVGIQVKSRGKASIKSNVVKLNKLQGVWVYEDGTAVVEKNDLRFNEKGGLKIEKDAGSGTTQSGNISK